MYELEIDHSLYATYDHFGDAAKAMEYLQSTGVDAELSKVVDGVKFYLQPR